CGCDHRYVRGHRREQGARAGCGGGGGMDRKLAGGLRALRLLVRRRGGCTPQVHMPAGPVYALLETPLGHPPIGGAAHGQPNDGQQQGQKVRTHRGRVHNGTPRPPPRACSATPAIGVAGRSSPNGCCRNAFAQAGHRVGRGFARPTRSLVSRWSDPMPAAHMGPPHQHRVRKAHVIMAPNPRGRLWQPLRWLRVTGPFSSSIGSKGGNGRPLGRGWWRWWRGRGGAPSLWPHYACGIVAVESNGPAMAVVP